jgi:hypothetical protein
VVRGTPVSSVCLWEVENLENLPLELGTIAQVTTELSTPKIFPIFKLKVGEIEVAVSEDKE